jgi:hypothetical protein
LTDGRFVAGNTSTALLINSHTILDTLFAHYPRFISARIFIFDCLTPISEEAFKVDSPVQYIMYLSLVSEGVLHWDVVKHFKMNSHFFIVVYLTALLVAQTS